MNSKSVSYNKVRRTFKNKEYIYFCLKSDNGNELDRRFKRLKGNRQVELKELLKIFEIKETVEGNGKLYIVDLDFKVSHDYMYELKATCIPIKFYDKELEIE